MQKQILSVHHMKVSSLLVHKVLLYINFKNSSTAPERTRSPQSHEQFRNVVVICVKAQCIFKYLQSEMEGVFEMSHLRNSFYLFKNLCLSVWHLV